MRSAWLTLAILTTWAVVAEAAEPVTVVAEQVQAIAAGEGEAEAAVLLVFVVDDAGDPMDNVSISVLADGKEIGSAETDPRGRALLRLAFAGRVVVRAVEADLAPSEARGVELRKAGLTALALPLQEKAAKGK